MSLPPNPPLPTHELKSWHTHDPFPGLPVGGGRTFQLPPDPAATIASLTRMLETAQKALEDEIGMHKKTLELLCGLCPHCCRQLAETQASPR